MPALIGLFLLALTAPIWGGAISGAVAFGFYLLVNFPIPFLVIGGGLLLLTIV